MKRLLVIEDDQLLASVYLKKFSMAGITAKIATTGQEGLQLAASYQPHAMLLDLMLPDMSGLDVLRALRADADRREMPVLVFTNAFLPGTIQQARAAGATEVLTKSDCTVTQLVEKIKGVFAASRYEPPAGVTAAPPPPPPPEVDLHKMLREQASPLQAALARFQLMPSDTSRLIGLSQATHAVAGNAAAAGEATLAWVASALEALLRELVEKPKHRNPSSANTVSDAVKQLVSWLRGESPMPQRRPSDCKVLSVDDDPIIGQLVSAALVRAQLRCRTMQDPVQALAELTAQPVDLLLLDVEMPVMEGPALCAELRKLPERRNIPVIFVTAVGEYERRMSSLASGGDDLLAKPFLPMELAVKALTHLLRRRTT